MASAVHAGPAMLSGGCVPLSAAAQSKAAAASFIASICSSMQSSNSLIVAGQLLSELVSAHESPLEVPLSLLRHIDTAASQAAASPPAMLTDAAEVATQRSRLVSS